MSGEKGGQNAREGQSYKGKGAEVVDREGGNKKVREGRLMWRQKKDGKELDWMSEETARARGVGIWSD